MANTAGFPNARAPRRSGGGRRLRFFAGAIGVLLTVGVSIFRNSSIFYTDYLWFQSVNLTNVWGYLLSTKVLLGVASVLITFALLWLNIWVADRGAPRALSPSQEDELARQYQRFVRPRAGRVRTAVAAALALFGGAGFASHWQEFILFRNGGNFGVKDPQFNMDIGFFVFKLPFLTTLLNWLLYTLVFALLVSLVVHYLQGSIRPQAATNRFATVVKKHVSILLALLALTRAAQYFLDRYRLSYSERGVVQGANYTDINFLLPALGLLTLISITAAVVLLLGVRSRSWSVPAITVALWGLVSVLVVSLIPAAVQRFSVEPSESQKEAKFIERNITATRQALGLHDVKVNDFAYDEQLGAAGLQENAQTIRNVRLWDPTFAQPSYQRLQENRSFFQFANVDIDRYPVQGQTTQLNVAVRELNIGGLPQERRSWVNQHLAFTHGYGAVASPANAVANDGAPVFSVKDLPPVGTPEITQPQVYFGEYAKDYSIVRTAQPEIDYTAPDGRDQTSSYQGSGGVPLDNVVKRAAFAARTGDLQPLISELVTGQSKAMYLTNIRERQLAVAPFLKFDMDPYPVLLDGRILWMQDAYTSTNYYPNAQRADTSLLPRGPGSLGTTAFNYVRNSVKVVTDAYDGTMTFYVMDGNDPIIKAWQKAFPKLFVDGSTMDADLRAHVRYPEDIFRVQTTMYGRYHLDQADDFYSQSDRWNIAQNPDREGGTEAVTTQPPTLGAPVARPTNQAENRIDPYYLLMRLPGEERESFLMLQPFVPFSQDDTRKELSSFMIAKSDPEDYGELQSFVMPRGQQVKGPALVEARIQQEPAISQYITLLSQRGSNVRLGNMLIIPIENSLLYVRPLYVEAQQTKVPELNKVIIVFGERVIMADTLQEALTQIFGSAPATQEANAGGVPTTPPGATGAVPAPVAPGQPQAQTPLPLPGQRTPQEVTALLNRADGEFAAADQALRNGDLAEYQRRVQAGIALVREARGS